MAMGTPKSASFLVSPVSLQMGDSRGFWGQFCGAGGMVDHGCALRMSRVAISFSTSYHVLDIGGRVRSISDRL